MGKFEKKHTEKRNTTEPWQGWEEEGYSLDNLRQVHEGRAVYVDSPGPVCESSAVRSSQADFQPQPASWENSPWQSDPRQPEPWQSNPWQANVRQANSWQSDPLQADPRQGGYSEAAARSGRGNRRRLSPESQRIDRSAQAPAGQPPRKRRRRKHRILRLILHIPITLFGLLILFVLGSILFAKMPQTDQPIGPRKDGVCTVLLCGTDLDGQRTDTMVLLYLDRNQKTTRLLSLPRDTMVNRDNPVPKLNGAYWANGGDKGDTEKGMNMLMDYVKDLVGYRPDAYMLISLDCFQELVDGMGGVTFDVPMDMYYNDPSQNLKIDLKAGTQKLNGQAAMWLVRFRSGYAMADLDRVKVQRDFLKAAVSQWKSLVRLPRAVFSARLLIRNTESNLNYRNLCWIALTLAKGGASSFESDTLPGEPAWVKGGAYYVQDRQKTAALINEKYNPYEKEIKADDLHPYGH